MKDVPEHKLSGGVPLDLLVWIVRVVEFATVLSAGLVAVLLYDDRISAEIVDDYVRVTIAAAVIFLVLGEMVGSYDVDALFSLRRAWQRVTTAWFAACLFLITIGFLLKISADFSRIWATTWALVAVPMLLVSRALMTVWIRRLKQAGTFNQRVAIFGASAQGERLARYIQSHSGLTITLIGFFDDRREGRVPLEVGGLPVLGTLDELVRMIRASRVDQVIVALPWSADARIQSVVGRLALTPVRIRLAPDLASFAFTHRPVVLLGDLPMMTLFERPISGMDALVKAFEDRVLATLITVVLAPVLLLVALAVKLDSQGPIFFRQPREGFNDRPFRVWKFRSMRPERCEVDGIAQATVNDDRITRVGRWLRRFSLDELPQLFNVLAGDMSLVGPRPHAPSTRAGGRLFSEVIASYAMRHKVKPGITGWAQVCGWRGETDTEAKLVKRFEHDLYYIENWSVWLDFYILFRTIIAVLVPRNAH